MQSFETMILFDSTEVCASAADLYYQYGGSRGHSNPVGVVFSRITNETVLQKITKDAIAESLLTHCCRKYINSTPMLDNIRISNMPTVISELDFRILADFLAGTDVQLLSNIWNAAVRLVNSLHGMGNPTPNPDGCVRSSISIKVFGPNIIVYVYYTKDARYG